MNLTGLLIGMAIIGAFTIVAAVVISGGQASASTPRSVACICHNLTGLSSDELARRRQLLADAQDGNYQAAHEVFLMAKTYPDGDNLACWYLQTASYDIKYEFDQAWREVTHMATQYGW